MKLGRFFYANKTFFGAIEDGLVKVLKSLEPLKISDQSYPLEKLKILPPVKPSKIVCVGLNYKDHAKELGLDLPEKPVLFLKPPTCVIGHNENIIYPEHMSRQVDYEGELAVVIKKECRNVKPQKVDEYILGYTCANDVTARDLQPKNGQWTVAKSFDTFLPIGPIITDEIDPNNSQIKTYLNGKLVQNSNTSNFIFTVQELVSYVSSIMTLKPFDVIITGTPSGIGSMKKGDVIEVEIEGIGRLTNYVK
ncbi:5-carboxymethyl-2-hydroxymuconate Delta-isomerase [Caldicellulosiruptor owensensis OL]|uniref:5-carboxymethyl-2-hydroxymuconate Delta-isomerase n=1 Tax=Caldicellulosiruptor owensensis (strain ATCC 700167 / DSM 13100 / OL) TaxID=632518 RepID=E4Q575_CALOW|nr:fumarylacetoacetate hydrolase family protein [Caldicellulosiruptor owensensis]ADQ04242.1 5-carboxymethyl-2-hydroxymuconate Delta-isomerase [Caldicellulosiruptor owensensis OL]